MKRKRVILVVGFLAAFILVVPLSFNNDSTIGQETANLGEQRLGGNSIYVDDMPPSSLVPISFVNLQRPGFVAIHQDSSGKPGQILGVSKLLGAEESTDVFQVPLSRMTRDNERLFAIIYFDDGNGALEVEKDMPAIDPITGENVMMIFYSKLGVSSPNAVNP